MTFKQAASRPCAILLSTLLLVGAPVGAQNQPDNLPSNQSPAASAESDRPTLIAQASPGVTAAEVAGVAAVGSVATKKQKGELLLTDSLWGNLILDLAYQRDPELRKLAKRLNLVNLGTMGAITGIAGGTLAQGIIALSVLNPPDPKSDSYLPGALGVGFSGITILTFAGRTVLNQVIAKGLRKRQLEIKHQVESILAKIEDSHGENPQAQAQLISLIGERATNEWLQLWRSSNVIATVKQPKISVVTPSSVLVTHQM